CDDILARTGLYEQLAARLEVRAETRAGAAAAAVGAAAGAAAAGAAGGDAATSREASGAAYVELARLCAGPLASVDRALDAWIEALSANPGCSEAKGALRAHAASMRDQG